MTAMRTASIREFGAHLRAYLREIERGAVVLVTDHGRVVAELRAPTLGDRAMSRAELRYRELVESGVLRPATQDNRSWLSLPALRLPPGSAQALLADERHE